MSFLADIRYGLRRLKREAVFSLIGTLCVGLGLGAGVAVFSVGNVLLLRPVPGVERVRGLVSLRSAETVQPGSATQPLTRGLSYPDYRGYRRSLTTLRHLAGYVPRVVTWAVAAGDNRRLDALFVTDNYFAALGSKPAHGRLFAPGERARQRVLVVSHDLWRQSLAGEPDLAGLDVKVNGQSFSVLGVAPPELRGTQRGDDVDLWLLPEAMAVADTSGPRIVLDDRDSGPLMWLIARLAPGATVRQAQDELDELALRLTDPGPPEHRPARLTVYPGIGARPWQRSMLTDPVSLLAFAVALLIAAVWANQGGLLLVQAAGRQEEFRMRIALGGTKPQLVRQLLIEGLVLSLAGGAVGLAVAAAGTRLLRGFVLGPHLPRLTEIPIDVRVLLFTLCLTALSGAVFGLVPAWWVSRKPYSLSIYPASGPGRLQLLEWLTMGQVALSLVLLVFTGLFVRSLSNLQAVPAGFAPERVLNVRFQLDASQPDAGIGAQLVERLAAQPQIQRASLASLVPLGEPHGPGGFTTFKTPREDEAELVLRNSVAPGYFATMGIPLLAGRDFRPTDPAPLVIDEALAQKHFPAGDAIGAQALVAESLREIIGVVGNVHAFELTTGSDPMVYLPFDQHPESSFAVQVRVTGQPTAAVDAVRSAVSELAPTLPLVSVTLYRDEVAKALAQPRAMSQLCGAISLISLVVTSLGLYGTLAYTVSRRRRELGIRMALGAPASKIVRLVVGRGLVLTAVGLFVGIFVAAWATSLLNGLLFGVEPNDPAVFCGVIGLILLIGLAASWLPARNAARVDPLTVIRHE